MNANGLGINGFAMRYYTNPAFKLGAFTNPDKKIRQEAIDLTKKGIDVARQSNSNLMTLWLGQDGFDYGFQADYKKLWQDEIDGIREVALHDKECQISIEYKPNEPRADDDLPSSRSSSLKDLVGFMSFKIKSLISSPDKVSYIKRAFANL